MLAVFTPDTLTPLSFGRAADAMRAALHDALKATPSPAVLALALAKNALETARWESCHNYNLGNVKATDSYVGMFSCFACGENLADGEHWFEPDGTDRNRMTGTVRRAVAFEVPPGHPQTRFRAYANEYDGSYAYVEFVAAGRYALAWQQLLRGDAVGFVHDLRLKGYFTAPEAPYAAGVVSLQREFVAKLSGLAAPPAVVDWHAAQSCAAEIYAWRAAHDLDPASGLDPSTLGPDDDTTPVLPTFPLKV